MTIDKQSILSLTMKQASLFHGMVLEFLHNNIVDVLDYGLMDDILLQAYEDNVGRLLIPDTTDSDRASARDTLASTLYTMIQFSQEHIASRTPYPIFASFIKFLEDNYYLLLYPITNNCS